MIDRVFLGSGVHLLPALAAWLLDRHASGGVADCSHEVVSLPTGRARRRLEVLLLDEAEVRGLRLIPPELTTPSGLLDRFLVPQACKADAFTTQIAWLGALNQATPKTLASITGHDEPPNRREAIALSIRLHRLMHDLGAGGYSPCEAADHCIQAGLPLDRERFDALSSLLTSARDHLNAAGCIDANESRRVLLDRGDLLIGDVEAVTVVSADPTRLLSRLLEQLSDNGVHVRSVIHGEAAAIEDAFDSTGGVCIEAWEARSLDLGSARIITCDRVDDQVAVVLDHLADRTESEREVDPDNMTIVVPDDAVLPLMIRHLEHHGVPVQASATRPVEQGRIGRLIEILAAFLDEGEARGYGDLVRHPDVEAWLQGQGVRDPVSRWDALWNRHLPTRLSEFKPGSKAHRDFVAVLGPLRDLLDALFGDPRPAGEWAKQILSVIGTILSGRSGSGETGSGDVELDPHDEAAISTIRTILETQLDLSEAPTLPLHASDVLRLLLEQIRFQHGHFAAFGLPIIGWLDAHLDDADDLIITGLNEGYLPAPTSVDPWLPEAAREVLGLSSQRRRAARDAWLLSAICSSGRRVTLVSARRSLSGDPLTPSRLLTRVAGVDLAHRIQALVDDTRRGSELSRWRATAEVESKFIARPLPHGHPIIDRISVTAFRVFLKDPAAFLFERDQRLRLSSVETADSLSPMDFGSFVHEVLERWGRIEADRDKPTTNEADIACELLDTLADWTRERFGQRVLAPIRLQAAIAATRLQAFGERQAQWAQAGWRISEVELEFGKRGHPAPVFPSEEDGLALTGKIDRLDQHPELGFVALDYKTAAKATPPAKAHRTSKGIWKDLQLPLYQVLLESVQINVPPTGLGYVNLPPNAEAGGFLLTTAWTEEDLLSARDKAAEVIEVIQSGGLLQVARESLA